MKYFAWKIDGLNGLALKHLIIVLIREGVNFEATFWTSDWMLEYDDVSDSVRAEMNEIIREMNKSEASTWERRSGSARLIDIIPSH